MTAIVTVFALAISALAADGVTTLPSQLPMLRDPAALRQYALASVVRGARYVTAESLDWSDPARKTDTQATGVGAEQVIDKLLATEQTYRLLDPKDLVRGFIYLYDANDHLVFYGYAEYKPGVSKELPKYSVWLQSVTLLEGVTGAELLVVDKDEVTIQRTPMVLENGRIVVGLNIAGAPNGKLVVHSGNTAVFYDLWKPEGQGAPSVTEKGGGYEISGHYIFKDTSVVKIIELWQRPTVLVEVTQETTVSVDVAGVIQTGTNTTIERPTEVIVSDVTGKQLGVVQTNGGIIQLKLGPGKYRLLYTWKLFGQPENIYVPTNGGRG